ncbi:hypothetical protein KKA00_08970, partial [bacterium]|nr:hypothetical protein [bacterium]
MPKVDYKNLPVNYQTSVQKAEMGLWEKIYYPEETLATKFEKGELEEVRLHLLEFAERHAGDIRMQIEENGHSLVEAIRLTVLKKGGIHLPTEMAEQIREINR